jgi:hypothetical protein
MPTGFAHATARAPERTRALFNHLAMLVLAGAALLVSAAAWADPPGRVGRLAEARGTVWMFDAEQGEWVAAQRNRPLTAGDRLSVERDARAELQIGSATLRLAGGSEIEITDLDDQRVGVHLHDGSLALRLSRNESAREFTVTTAAGRFEPQRAGSYRIDEEEDASFGGVNAGALHFESNDSALDIAAGRRAEFWSEGGVTHYSWARQPNDRFADWVAQQERQDERDARQRYVSPEMTGAEDLDRYGQWDRHPEYGTVWVPQQVVPGWAPYRYGSWAYVQPWGWTWVDDAPWGFAPFHYGRWVWWGGRWAWAPGQYVARPVYAPALVAWIGGPNFSIGINLGGPAVGWVPLAPREVYVPTYSVTNVYVSNINRPYQHWHPPAQPRQPRPIMYTNQGVPGGVTVVSQQVLRERRPISNAVIAPVDARTLQQWQRRSLSSRDERGPINVAPPAPARPTARVVAPPGAAVPAAPGVEHTTPWGQIRRSREERPTRTGDGGDSRRGSPPATSPRGDAPRTVDRAVTTRPKVPMTVPPQREGQDRRGRSQDDGRAPGQDRRRGAPLQHAQPQAPQQPQQPVQPAQATPPAQPVMPAPQARTAPGRDKAGVARERGNAQDPDRDDREPPGRSGRREQQNQ